MISRMLQGWPGKSWYFLWTITASTWVFRHSTVAKLFLTASGLFADGVGALLTHPSTEVCTHLASNQWHVAHSNCHCFFRIRPRMLVFKGLDPNPRSGHGEIPIYFSFGPHAKFLALCRVWARILLEAISDAAPFQHFGFPVFSF